jgi:hypothetical protein
MTPSEIAPSDFVARLHDPAWRARLVAACARETGSNLPLSHAVYEAASKAVATADELRALVTSLLADELDWVLDSLVVNPAMPEDVLLSLAHAGHCTGALGHLRGPRSLLVTMVELHRYPEAILSLAIDLYRDPTVSAADFAAFVETHRDHEWMLRALAGCEPSDDDKRRVYEALLDAPVGADAVVFHGAHRMASSAWTTERLAEWLDRHDGTELLLKLLSTEASSPEKRALVGRRCEERADRAEIRAEVARRALVDEAAGTSLAAARARVLFETGDVDVRVALARNRETPRDLLEEMTALREVAGSRVIRGVAKQMLRARGVSPKTPRWPS